MLAEGNNWLQLICKTNTVLCENHRLNCICTKSLTKYTFTFINCVIRTKLPGFIKGIFIIVRHLIAHLFINWCSSDARPTLSVCVGDVLIYYAELSSHMEQKTRRERERERERERCTQTRNKMWPVDYIITGFLNNNLSTICAQLKRYPSTVRKKFEALSITSHWSFVSICR